MAQFFKKGDKVEIVGCTTKSYHSAKIVRVKLPDIKIKYDHIFKPDGVKRFKQHVDVQYVRPMVPTELNKCFAVGETVNYFHDLCWNVGRVVEILENDRYLVKNDCDGTVREFDIWSTRMHREWDNGIWVPALDDYQMKSSELAENPRKFKLKIKFYGRPVGPIFSTGTHVEVQQDPNQQVGRAETKTAFKPSECSPKSKKKLNFDAEFSNED